MATHGNAMATHGNVMAMACHGLPRMHDIGLLLLYQYFGEGTAVVSGSYRQQHIHTRQHIWHYQDQFDGEDWCSPALTIFFPESLTG